MKKRFSCTSEKYLRCDFELTAKYEVGLVIIY
jgi:hypothetical protein